MGKSILSINISLKSIESISSTIFRRNFIFLHVLIQISILHIELLLGTDLRNIFPSLGFDKKKLIALMVKINVIINCNNRFIFICMLLRFSECFIKMITCDK